MTPSDLAKLTPEEKQLRIAELCGKANRFVLVKRGLYWRPDAHGYTGNIAEAWILSEAEADKYIYPHDEPVTKRRAPLPDYLGSLDVMREVEVTLSAPEHYTFRQNLWELTDCSRDRSCVGVDGEEHTRRYCSATAAQRADAFLLTLA